MRKTRWNVYTITMVAVMAALTYVVTIFRIPLGQSKIHFANAVCLLAGMLLGPLPGGLAAGLGSALYDVLAGGYGFVDALITFVSKFAMAWVCGMLLPRREEVKLPRLITAAVAGSLTYVALYMLKTFILGLTVKGLTMDATLISMGSKLPASLINAAFATVTAPLLMTALHYPLRRQGILKE